MIAPMTLPRFELRQPLTVEEACEALATGSAGGLTCAMAGGTDLVVKMKTRSLQPATVVSLGRIEALREIGETAQGGLLVGAACTMDRLSREPRLAGGWKALAEGAGLVGGPLIRNRATVGGNIINARPCADTVPALLCADAKLHLQRSGSRRVIEINGFTRGPGQPSMERDELLTHIELPPLPPGQAGSCYLKFGRRAAMEITTVGVAALLVLDGDRVVRARIALTSVGPTILRVPRGEAVLEGEVLSDEAIARAAVIARETATPITDQRAPAAFRSQLCEVLTARALRAAAARARGGAA